MNDDLISRAAAIDALRKYIGVNKNPNHDARIWEEGMNCALTVIGALPSAQPEPCEDAVSREAAIDAALSAFSRGLLASPDIRRLPPAQPERKTGRWINVRHDNIAECSSCGVTGRAWMNFCFDCGADLRGDSDDQSK